MSNDVVSETAAWYARIAAARVAGIELEELSVALRKVVSTNYFGIGCVEGAALYEELQYLIETGARSLNTQSLAAIELSSGASAACHALTRADADNTDELQPDGVPN
ncbi:hypothetical protein L5G32_09950 [Gordonia sp. HY002]|uniref:hypothetical protein n=1 Tax=Gordonia zhenghanii TaxID=2911516 RepID=UPI001EF0482C|nr:hypothetical protein [Gordonia zhenghanii]MCF8570591.1 hypothetical protein [Gordonia zhenghanii]MCF8606610.1 hypothetical protein [Gordonia zhenghanii]